MIADNCVLLSGKNQHGYKRRDIPMRLQKGSFERKKINKDCWIGSNSIILESVNKGSIVGAGSCVLKEFNEYSIIGGSPAKFIKSR